MNNYPIATLLNLSCSNDERGSFIKTFSSEILKEISNIGFNFELLESYYTFSKRCVIRGMHFQSPPHDHHKLVHVLQGKITDVVLDIRKNSPTFGQFFSFELNDAKKQILFIPKGFAHGFCAREDSLVQYYQTSGYSPTSDHGIHYNSFGFDWNNNTPTLSARDQGFPHFNNFNSPF